MALTRIFQTGMVAANSTVNGAMTTAAQTFAGLKTFAAGIDIPSANVARFYRSDAARHSSWGHDNDGSYINNSAAGDNFEFKSAGTRVAFFDGTGRFYERSRTAAMGQSVGFNPEVYIGGSTTGITYSSRTGTYCLIGNHVFYDILFQLSSKGSNTGSVTLEGLPVSMAGTPMGSMDIAGASGFTGMPMIVAVGTIMYFGYWDAAGANREGMTNAHWGNGTIVRISMFARAS